MRLLLALLLLFETGGCAARSCRRGGGIYQSNRCFTPAHDAGKPCRDGSECQYGRCQCPPELDTLSDQDKPALEGAEATGVCGTWPLMARGVWVCLVADGRVVRDGLIGD